LKVDITSLRGTYDILPPQSRIWERVEHKARELFDVYGYSEIRTPIFEDTRLFTRSIGENTDIVSKEMYTFSDRKERSITLRPEATAPVVRAYLQHKIHQTEPLSRFFYIGPMFRYERPQAGRNRQFYQLGTEILGSENPYFDAESISLAVTFFKNIGIDNINVKLNSVGCKDCKINYSKILKDYFMPKIDQMCDDCKIRHEKNTLRILDCKVPTCRQQMTNIPILSDNLCEECENHFTKVKSYLESMEVPYIIEPYLVRGLDYYTNTIFEITHSHLGSQDALGGGGRYNNLVEEMGGPSTGAVGFAVGIDRLIIVLEKIKESTEINYLDLYILNLENSVFVENVKIVHQLRQANIKVDLCPEEKSMKSQFRTANKLNARFVLIRAKNEIENNIVKLKNMVTNTEEEIQIDNVNIIDEISERVKRK